MRVGLVFGGRSTEHRVSVVSARTVAAALAAAGHEVVPVPIARDGSWLRPEEGRRALEGELDLLRGGAGACTCADGVAAPRIVPRRTGSMRSTKGSSAIARSSSSVARTLIAFSHQLSIESSAPRASTASR